MNTLTDTYGHTVTQSEDGTWSRDGCIVGPCDADTARMVFDGMAPAGWIAPIPPRQVPDSVTNFQARAILLRMPGSAAGRSLFNDVDDALKALGGEAFQAWEFGNDFMRDGLLVSQMGVQFGMSPAQIDALFIAASSVSA